MICAVLVSAQTRAAQDKPPPAKGSVLDEILDILRKGGRISEEQTQIRTGIDENFKSYLRTPDGDFRLELNEEPSTRRDADQHYTSTRFQRTTGLHVFPTGRREWRQSA